MNWTEDGIEYEADKKHRLDLMTEEGLLEDSRSGGEVELRGTRSVRRAVLIQHKGDMPAHVETNGEPRVGRLE